MFDRFSDRSRKVMNLAKGAAQRLNHQFIGTEHILLALVEEGSGVAANVLRNMAVDLRRIPLEIEKLLPASPTGRTIGNLPFTPGAKRVLEHALEHSAELGHDHLGTEHLLLGLITVTDSVAGRVLTQLGLTFASVREAVVEFLGPPRTRELQRATLFLSRAVIGRVSIAFAIHRAIPAAMAAALAPDQRLRIASILEQRMLDQLASSATDQVMWVDDFDVALDESGQLSDAQAKELIERHWRLTGVMVDAPSPSLADREMGLHFISQRRTFSLRLGNERWLEEITLDDITLKVPIDVVLTWTIARAQTYAALS